MIILKTERVSNLLGFIEVFLRIVQNPVVSFRKVVGIFVETCLVCFVEIGWDVFNYTGVGPEHD